jgi:hypothetical protein
MAKELSKYLDLAHTTYQRMEVYYSYETCDAKDYFTEKQVSLIGQEECRCIGFSGIDGTTRVNLNGAYFDYPAQLGGFCQAWDSARHPSCLTEDAPEWCNHKWCFVDPCSCRNLTVPPKKSLYLPDVTFQGKPLFISYSTCGSLEPVYNNETRIDRKVVAPIDRKEKLKRWVKQRLTGGLTRREKIIAAVCKPHIEDPRQDSDRKMGSGVCPCIGFKGSPGLIYPSIGAGEGSFSYPRSVGSFCAAWDSDRHPRCKGTSSDPECESEWCYVDPLTCAIPALPVRSKLLQKATYQDVPLYYSYATCSVDPTGYSVMVFQNESSQKGLHPEPGGSNQMGPPTFTYALGVPTCRCIGFEKWPGTTIMNYGDLALTYPKEVGSHCDTWDVDHHPECQSDDRAPAWCEQKWCYVDPCSCAIGEPPTRAEALLNATFQKHSVYYSYATCGGKEPYATKDAEDEAWDTIGTMCRDMKFRSSAHWLKPSVATFILTLALALYSPSVLDIY